MTALCLVADLVSVAECPSSRPSSAGCIDYLLKSIECRNFNKTKPVRKNGLQADVHFDAKKSLTYQCLMPNAALYPVNDNVFIFKRFLQLKNARYYRPNRDF